MKPLKSRLKDYLLSRGVWLKRLDAPVAEVMKFVDLVRNSMVGVDLIRVGGRGDGGYLIPDDLGGIRYCFSPGVDVTSRFEQELAVSFGIKSFMADASVEAPPSDHDLFDFDAKYLGSKDGERTISLPKWINEKVGEPHDGDLLLQMDIEGSEYEVLIAAPRECLRRFRIMVIEFHQMDRLFDRHDLTLYRAVFHKILRDFSIVHIHPNNCCGQTRFKGVSIPRIVEISFVRHDRIEELANNRQVVLPHPLDTRNVSDKADLPLPEMWWTSVV